MLEDPANLFVVDLASAAGDAAGVHATVQVKETHDLGFLHVVSVCTLWKYYC